MEHRGIRYEAPYGLHANLDNHNTGTLQKKNSGQNRFHDGPMGDAGLADPQRRTARGGCLRAVGWSCVCLWDLVAGIGFEPMTFRL
jgi:hypothetical protein